MVRPTDTYTHEQFDRIDSPTIGGTVRCRHCKQWQGSAKVLNRKKEHLRKCPEYAAWRAAGNGRDLSSKNPYARGNSHSRNGSAVRESKGLVEWPFASALGTRASGMQPHRRATVDLTKYFDEFVDDSLVSKDVRVRCQSCGFVRAKNEAWQAEHLSQCQDFLSTTEGADLLASGSLAAMMSPPRPNAAAAFWTPGPRPNVQRPGSRHSLLGRAGTSPHLAALHPDQHPQLSPTANAHPHLNANVHSNRSPNLASAVNLHVNGTMPGHRSGDRPRMTGAASGGPSTPRPSSPRGTRPVVDGHTPSLAQHLLVQGGELLSNGTRHAFLSHAGCGLLSEAAVVQWLSQIGFISRSLVSFTGALIGKVRISELDDLEQGSTFRCLDLLCSAVNNMKNELVFLEATKRKYGLEAYCAEPKPPTKGFIDLFNSASCPSATLLEGMVMLWAIETLFHMSFTYAATFVTQRGPTATQGNQDIQRNPGDPSSHPGSLSSSLSSASGGAPIAAADVGVGVFVRRRPKDSHTTAIREAFIENWKSENFGRFVDACRAIVDELAMAHSPRSGWDEISACERVFKQAVWLWGQMFPEVVDMEEDRLQDRRHRQDRQDHQDGKLQDGAEDYEGGDDDNNNNNNNNNNNIINNRSTQDSPGASRDHNVIVGNDPAAQVDQ